MTIITTHQTPNCRHIGSGDDDDCAAAAREDVLQIHARVY
jgi:hypothetical protein